MIPETPLGGGPAGTGTVGESRTSGGDRSDVLSSGTESPGAVLRFLASALRAKAVVEVGTGTGANTLPLLRGMRPDGVLTSIDHDPDAQRDTRARLVEAGISAARLRLINGVAERILPRLTEGGYDLVLVSGPPQRHPGYLAVVVRLLRPGGVVVFDRVRPEETLLADHPACELARAIDADESLVPAALPVGNGLLAVARS